MYLFSTMNLEYNGFTTPSSAVTIPGHFVSFSSNICQEQARSGAYGSLFHYKIYFLRLPAVSLSVCELSALCVSIRY